MAVLFESGDALLWDPSPRVAKMFLAEVRAVEEAVGVQSGIGDLIADEVAVDSSVLCAFVSTIGQTLDTDTSSVVTSLYAAVFAISYGLLAVSGVAKPPFLGQVGQLAHRGELLISGRGRPGPIYEGLGS
jgi:Family of unknown function (DUF6086)